MKSDVRPAYGDHRALRVRHTFRTRSTKESGRIVVEVCSQCHPFYTASRRFSTAAAG